MRLLDTVTIYANPAPLLVSRQAMFPGLVRLDNGELIAMFSIGQAFDAADTRAHVSRSTDNGKTWSAATPLHDATGAALESETFKPLLLADGTILATGYVFVRPDALTPIVDPETLEVLPLHNKHARSTDGGLSWTVPERFEVDGRGLELSGPCIQLASGRIIGAAPPFHLGADGHTGWIIASDDNGQSWYKLSEFFASPAGNVSAWESRLCEYAPGKVAVLFWAYDNATGTNLNNHLVLSDNGGASFGTAIDTGIHGQASNLVPLDANSLLTIHAHREQPVGLVVRRIALGETGIAVQETLDLFSNNAMASNSADIAQQFGSLKFGQPSLLPLGGGEYLAVCWQLENSQHIIKGFRLTL
ncbi:hypothetical protein WH87_12100 [Devosia epidermidihirudinis]|uniref:Sialidase domain-containing protein n=1 Tax=Devosia epidermidihirudinis TaxID=1293439 RepID=A0A0F5Q999_9HYPH|nr:sialidase family protein [Devosia epidermidihirudinis]KKC37291.1 hypothetical protein WH87_12100 [Devosia epidermidihirudinis]